MQQHPSMTFTMCVLALAAMSYRVRQGRPFNRPPQNLSYSETFLYLLDWLNEEDYKPNPVFVKALDKLFIVHGWLLSSEAVGADGTCSAADHEMNCSTAA